MSTPKRFSALTVTALTVLSVLEKVDAALDTLK